jgi:PPOX class probable F420-dependent enzyme
VSHTFSEHALALLDGKNFAVFGSLHSDGSPRTSVMWYDFDGEALLFSALAHRRKVRNIERDPRVSVTVYDLANPYSSVEIRGTATVTPDPERTLSHRLSHRYIGEDPPADQPGTERVIIRLTPQNVVDFSGGEGP